MNISSNNWLLQEATTTGNGNILYPNRNDQITIFITGNSTSRQIYFEGCDANENWFSVPAVKLPEMTVSSFTTGNDEVWVISGTNWIGIRTRIASITGGTVKITAKIVDTNGMNFLNASNVSGSIDSKTILDSGTVTLATNTYLTDSSKDYAQNMFIGKAIAINHDNTVYLREIIGNAQGTIDFVPIQEPMGAIVIVGDGQDANGQVQIQCIGELIGEAGNDYSIQVIEAEDIEHSGEDTISLDTNTKLITITCYKNALGESRVLAAGTVETLINSTEGISDKFYVLSGWISGNIPFMAEATDFDGGSDGISPVTGDTYQIKDIEFPMLKGSSTDPKPIEYMYAGKLYLELDTGDVYRYTGAVWQVI